MGLGRPLSHGARAALECHAKQDHVTVLFLALVGVERDRQLAVREEVEHHLRTRAREGRRVRQTRPSPYPPRPPLPLVPAPPVEPALLDIDMVEVDGRAGG